MMSDLERKIRGIGVALTMCNVRLARLCIEEAIDLAKIQEAENKRLNLVIQGLKNATSAN
jgi:hypothetical protein